MRVQKFAHRPTPGVGFVLAVVVGRQGEHLIQRPKPAFLHGGLHKENPAPAGEAFFVIGHHPKRRGAVWGNPVRAEQFRHAFHVPHRRQREFGAVDRHEAMRGLVQHQMPEVVSVFLVVHPELGPAMPAVIKARQVLRQESRLAKHPLIRHDVAGHLKRAALAVRRQRAEVIFERLIQLIGQLRQRLGEFGFDVRVKHQMLRGIPLDPQLRERRRIVLGAAIRRPIDFRLRGSRRRWRRIIRPEPAHQNRRFRFRFRRRFGRGNRRRYGIRNAWGLRFCRGLGSLSRFRFPRRRGRLAPAATAKENRRQHNQTQEG